MGLRARLLLLVLVAAIPGLLLALYTNLQLRKLGTASVENDAMKAVQLLAASQDGLVEATRQHLAGLSRFPEARGTNTSSFSAFFRRLTRIYTNYTDFGLVEKNGDLIACSLDGMNPTNLADRPHVQRVLKTEDLSIGEYQAGHGATKASLLFGYPILDEQGKLFRVLYAALDLAVVKKSIVVPELPEGGVIQILDRGGHVLGRYPETSDWVGKSVSSSPVFANILANEKGSVEMKGADDVPRLYAFGSIRDGHDANLFVIVGIPTALAYGETKHILFLNLAILGVAAVLTLLVAWLYANRYVLNPVNTLASTTKRVAAGDLGARTGLAPGSGELHQLARAFDQMAESLQKQSSQINELNATLERRVAERTAQLGLLNKELEAFSYSVSHDLRAPLRHVGGFVEMLRQEAAATLTEKGRHFLDVILQATRRMGVLIENLLAFSRMSQSELYRSLIPMDGPVHEVLEEIKRGTESRNIQWQVESLPKVFADGAMMKQVWTNLFSNAVKYTRNKDQPQIQVGCRLQETEYEFYVRDNGAGFDMQYASKLFGVFQRLHTEHEFEGTGIGLANVRRIISRHGGRTWAEGKVDEGATFYFTLPSAPAADSSADGKQV